MSTAGHDLVAARDIWEKKKSLRAVYHDLYGRMKAVCRPGRTMEIGAGSGNLKEYIADIISIDVQSAPWVDAVADGEALPFQNGCFDNVLMFDVLHHMGTLRAFFSEASRVLAPRGRLVMIEPGITPLSGFYYKHFHPEPYDLDVDPLSRAVKGASMDPLKANQAIPTLLFTKYRKEFETTYPSLHVVSVSWLSLFAYPLTGGFRRWSLLPSWLVPTLLLLEKIVLPVLGPFMAFRLMVVLEHVDEK